MTDVQEIVFATGNAMKLKEVEAFLLDDAPETTRFRLINQNLDLPEEQGTIEEIAIAKCRRAAELVKGPVLVEDTALSFQAMGELPGPYIKWFLKELKCEGLFKMLHGFDDKSATAVCTFGFSPGPTNGSPEPPEVILFEGRTAGTIVSPRGPAVFGWNPIFEVQGTTKTYAEMSTAEKNQISHRSRALQKLRDHLNNTYKISN